MFGSNKTPVNFARYYSVSDSVHSSIQEGLMKWPARYTYSEAKSRKFVIPMGRNQFGREDVLILGPIRRLVVTIYLMLCSVVN